MRATFAKIAKKLGFAMFAGVANAAVPGIFAMLTLRRAQISIASHCGILYANQAGYLWMQLRIQQGPLFPR